MIQHEASFSAACHQYSHGGDNGLPQGTSFILNSENDDQLKTNRSGLILFSYKTGIGG